MTLESTIWREMYAEWVSDVYRPIVDDEAMILITTEAMSISKTVIGEDGKAQLYPLISWYSIPFPMEKFY